MAARLSALSWPPSNRGCVITRNAPCRSDAVEKTARRQGLLRERAGKIDPGIEIGSRHTDGRTCHMQLCLCGEDTRPPMEQFGWHTGGNFSRQGEIVQPEVGRRPVRRRLADQDCQRVTGRAFPLLKIGQHCSIGCQLALCGEQLRTGCGADPKCSFYQVNILGIVLDNPLQRLHLGMCRRHRQRLCRDVGCQG